jgi:uncharacterized protein YbjT (DUF2867 family)
MTTLAVLGARGFIGRNIAAALEARGATIRRLGRPECDLVRTRPDDLVTALAGAEVAVNAVGLLSGRLEEVHVDGVRNLVEACRQAGVRRLVHVSALGSAPDGATRYWSTKGIAEAFLAEVCEFEVRIVRPSLVVGPGGASTELFAALAALPVVPRIASGPLRPIALDDLVEIVARATDREIHTPTRIDAVGPDVMGVDGIVDALGAWLGSRPVGSLSLGRGLLALQARVSGALGIGPMDAEAFAMLVAGNSADIGSTVGALGRAPVSISAGLRRRPATAADRLFARLYFVRPMLRLTLAVFWIATGCLSFGLYPVEKSRALLADLGLVGAPASVALFGGAALDLFLGVLLLLAVRVKAVGGAMLTLMAAYTVLAMRLPADFWLHPLAPLLKNLPIAAAILAMIAMEE